MATYDNESLIELRNDINETKIHKNEILNTIIE